MRVASDAAITSSSHFSFLMGREEKETTEMRTTINDACGAMHKGSSVDWIE